MTFIAWVRSRSPDDTNPTAITVMIELDCTMIVDTQPVATPARRCVVASAMNRLSPRPLTACRPSDKCFIPSKKVPRPPATVKMTSNISFIICCLLYYKSVRIMLDFFFGHSKSPRPIYFKNRYCAERSVLI